MRAGLTGADRLASDSSASILSDGESVDAGGSSLLPATSDQPRAVARSARAPDEQELLDAIARSSGQAWTEANAELILEQARRFGDL